MFHLNGIIFFRIFAKSIWMLPKESKLIDIRQLGISNWATCIGHKLSMACFLFETGKMTLFLPTGLYMSVFEIETVIEYVPKKFAVISWTKNDDNIWTLISNGYFFFWIKTIKVFSVRNFHFYMGNITWLFMLHQFNSYSFHLIFVHCIQILFNIHKFGRNWIAGTSETNWL